MQRLNIAAGKTAAFCLIDNGKKNVIRTVFRVFFVLLFKQFNYVLPIEICTTN